MLRRHTSFLSFLYELSPYRSFLPQFLRAKILFYNSCCKLFITGETLIQETNRGNRALHSIGIRSAANELHELLYIVHGILWRDKMLVGSSFFHGKILNYHRSLMQGLDSTFHERFVFFARLDRCFPSILFTLRN